MNIGNMEKEFITIHREFHIAPWSAIIFYKGDAVHRDKDLPGLVYGQTIIYYRNNLWHRADMPAIVAQTFKEYYLYHKSIFMTK